MKYIALTLTLYNLIFSLDLRDIENIKKWNRLQDQPVMIEWCVFQNFPISKAEAILNHNIHSIAQAIQDLDNYPNIFDRVTRTHQLGENIVHIILDMPFPFEGRDYIVKYSTNKKPGYWMFSYSSFEDNIPLEQDHVRLPNAAGVWILYQISKDTTKVIYAWNGQLLGNFPDFGLEKAWITQGTEVLNWLDRAMNKKIES
tara:strand:+ start:748 stop:1347 length:600 start_codon:yes stop_codon:yes gene_type:complete